MGHQLVHLEVRMARWPLLLLQKAETESPRSQERQCSLACLLEAQWGQGLCGGARKRRGLDGGATSHEDWSGQLARGMHCELKWLQCMVRTYRMSVQGPLGN
eukprot:3942823-Amphidinium_carterae.2